MVGSVMPGVRRSSWSVSVANVGGGWGSLGTAARWGTSEMEEEGRSSREEAGVEEEQECRRCHYSARLAHGGDTY